MSKTVSVGTTLHRQLKGMAFEHGLTLQGLVTALLSAGIATANKKPAPPVPRAEISAEALDFQVCPACFNTWPPEASQCGKCGHELSA